VLCGSRRAGPVWLRCGVGAALAANIRDVAHRGPRWSSRGGDMATPFGCPAGALRESWE